MKFGLNAKNNVDCITFIVMQAKYCDCKQTSFQSISNNKHTALPPLPNFSLLFNISLQDCRDLKSLAIRLESKGAVMLDEQQFSCRDHMLSLHTGESSLWEINSASEEVFLSLF